MKRIPEALLVLALAISSLRGQGGSDHWAWQPLKNIVPPRGQAHPIDRFVDRGLAARGLARSPEAGRRTLYRRLSFDLHGLPPRPEDVEAFVRDPDARAYERLVDRLLASPSYGERYARHWLDLAHYADTHGFERDQRRDRAWPYRDWVIRSLNEDKSWFRFLEEQIAGNVLWPQDPDAAIATGFLAAGPWDFVGQVETKSEPMRRASRALDLDDMLTQVMTSTMALTVHCARCHDHKLDPVSQREYYALQSVFAGVKRGERKVHAAASSRLESQRRDLVREITRLEPGIDLAELVGGGDQESPGRRGQGLDPRTGKREDRRMGFLSDVAFNRVAPVASPFIDGVFVPRVTKDGTRLPLATTGLALPDAPRATGEAWDVVRFGPVNAQHSPSLSGFDFSKPPHTLLGLHANAGITFDLEAFRKALGTRELRFTTRLGYFGKDQPQFRADARVLVDGVVRAEFAGLRRADGLKAVELALPADARFLTLLSTDAQNGLAHDQVGFGDPKVLPRVPASEAERALLETKRSELRRLDRELSEFANERVYTVVPQEKVPLTRVLHRGDAESPRGEALTPGAPSLLGLPAELGELASPEGARRAALARWITQPQNALTRRVIVNRLWHWHFGQGLVDTPSDFGSGGGRPSHPELLDWLAAELDRQGGSLKALHRAIVTSETYRQRSAFRSGDPRHARDAANRLLWRQNPRRLEAEAVRDAILAVSGKLVLERGGPGYEDFDYREEYAPVYRHKTADEPALWRRSIYRYVVRGTPERFLTTLDCPDPAGFAPKRLATTTALQSLALYNNDFVLRQARYLAERLEAQSESTRGRIARAFALCFARPPTAREAELSARFASEEGLFAFSRSLLNLSEFIHVD